MHTALPRKMQSVGLELSNPVITDVLYYQTRVQKISKNSTNWAWEPETTEERTFRIEQLLAAARRLEFHGELLEALEVRESNLETCHLF
jgi:hypothetical protein